MTRTSFLALFGIGAAGQTTGGRSATYVIDDSLAPSGRRPDEWVEIRTKGSTPGRKLQISRDDRNPSNEWLFRKPLNGQCPVCGTMAPAYFPQKGRVVLTYPPSPWPDEPPTRTVSCSHCRVRFDQDAEDVR